MGCGTGAKPPVANVTSDAGSVVRDGSVDSPDGSSTLVDGGAAPLEGCDAVFACESACGSDAQCRAACDAEGSSKALQLVQALDTCLGAVCPSSSGSVCATAGSACQMCQGSALSHGCAVLYTACEGDGVATTDAGSAPQDGGSAFSDAGSFDGGASTVDGGLLGSDSCFEVYLCSGGCGSTTCTQHCLHDGTSVAQSQYTGLLDCIYGACPMTDGGVCDYSAASYNGDDCGTCLNTAESANHPCYADVLACTGTLCADDSACASTRGTPTCALTLGYCVQCLAPSDCPSGTACLDYLCQPADLSCIGIRTCTGEADCPSDETCAGGICVTTMSCQSDADCAGTSTPHCDSGTCGP
jgi:hypothetical protein